MERWVGKLPATPSTYGGGFVGSVGRMTRQLGNQKSSRKYGGRTSVLRQGLFALCFLCVGYSPATCGQSWLRVTESQTKPGAKVNSIHD